MFPESKNSRSCCDRDYCAGAIIGTCFLLHKTCKRMDACIQILTYPGALASMSPLCNNINVMTFI